MLENDERATQYRWTLARLERAIQDGDKDMERALTLDMQHFEENNREFMLLFAAAGLDDAASEFRAGSVNNFNYQQAIARVRDALKAMPQFPEVT